MYAAYSETMPAGIVKALLAKGADQSTTGEGETARSLAAKRGDTEVARLLGVPEEERRRDGVAAAMPASAEDRAIPEAVTKALAALEKQSHNFVRIAGCNSCHNQNLPSAAAAARPGARHLQRLARSPSCRMRWWRWGRSGRWIWEWSA